MVSLIRYTLYNDMMLNTCKSKYHEYLWDAVHTGRSHLSMNYGRGLSCCYNITIHGLYAMVKICRQEEACPFLVELKVLLYGYVAITI